MNNVHILYVITFHKGRKIHKLYTNIFKFYKLFLMPVVKFVQTAQLTTKLACYMYTIEVKKTFIPCKPSVKTEFKMAIVNE